MLREKIDSRRFSSSISTFKAKSYSSLIFNNIFLQEDVIKNKRRIALCFEGRDTAGKSSTINFFSEHLRPSNFRYIHLGIPTKEEKDNWFKRWEKHLPEEGKIALFDRS